MTETRAVWTLDLGNSSAKLRAWAPPTGGGRPVRVLARDVAGEDDPRAALAPLDGPPGGVAISSVAGAERTARWERALDELHPGARLTELAAGVDNRCAHPETVGADRLFAARGAAAVLGRSCIVVDAGTALTVDALRVEPAGPAFLGGAIAPGPGLLSRALAEGGAQLFEIEAHPGAPALGRETRTALEAGVSVGFYGAARELWARVAAEAEIEPAPVLLSGGASAFLRRPPWPTEVHEEPDLVHIGLYEAALDRLEGPGRSSAVGRSAWSVP